MPADEWTLTKLRTKIQNDIELHAQVHITPEELDRFINDAIDDAEEIIVNSFSDFFLTYKDTPVTVGDTTLTVPEDIYEMRLRHMVYDENQNNQTSNTTAQWYKLKKVPLEEISESYESDDYQYRITNDRTTGLQINIFPDIRETSTARFRIYYIRRAARLEEDLDVLEIGLRPQYIISHAKAAVYYKEGDPMYNAELPKLADQEKKLKDSISRLTDDKEDEFLDVDAHAMAEAYGEPYNYFA